jgi:TraX protein.
MSSYKLKWIAIISMTIDHTAKTLGQPLLLLFFPGKYIETYYALHVLTWIGRLAFPIFAYLIAEGCRKTRSMPRYIGRLAIFALISEPIFTLAFCPVELRDEVVAQLFRQLLSGRLTSVFATLALGVLAIYVVQLGRAESSKFPKWLAFPAILLIGIYSAYAKTDYDIFGVSLIVALYFCKNKEASAVTIILWSVVVYLGYSSFWSVSEILRMPVNYIMPCVFASISAVFIYFYKGERGKALKWTFYVFYPAHLTILYCINVYVVIPLFRAAS